jgi:RNA polymerase-associated protein LEO1
MIAADQHCSRGLDDEELDSGDDEGRADRAHDDGDATQYEELERLAMDVEFQRQPIPEPTDGEVRYVSIYANPSRTNFFYQLFLLKVPHFLAIEPQEWQTTTFQPPTTEHHSKKRPSETFSAYDTAMTTVRWRHSPTNAAELQSNARINRWEDGSLTLQMASDPKIHYEFDCNLISQPQPNPKIPTPTAALAGSFRKDQFTYLVAPVESAESLRVTHKITAGLLLKNPQFEHDQAIQMLKLETMQLASTAKVVGVSGDMIATEEDPELGRKRAEIAERSAIRDRKKRENAQERERLRTDRTMGRSGLSSTRYGGLNVGMLEDDEMENSGGRAAPSKARAKPRRRRNSEYSEDEDFGRKRFTKEDSYDQEDDFLAPSDEEEIVDDDDDPDDGIIDEPRQRSPKRDRPRPSADDGAGEVDADAEGEEEADEEGFQAARGKRRRVVDEDDDE